jgi:S1-C subfamily serine protease
MKRALVLAIAAWLLSFSANAKNVLTGKEIYRVNCKSVVQIQTEDGFGVGFIVSSDGLIMTANHVVTTRASKFREYASDIKVAVFGKPTPYTATPIVAAVSDDQANYDSTVIKIKSDGLSQVTLGDWAAVDAGDPVTIIPSFPGFGCILLEGIVAAKGSAHTDMGPKPVNTIIFQSPIRNGFSGSPIFDSKGNVIGIEDTKVFGISLSLSDLRAQWAKTASMGRVAIMGIDIAGSFTDIINNLDQNLISGLGSGVDIGYAKQEQEEAKNRQH